METLGEDRIHFLLEVFKPGDVFHVDCLVYNKEIKFISCSKYLSPPMAVSHDGGIFRTKHWQKIQKTSKVWQKSTSRYYPSLGLYTVPPIRNLLKVMRMESSIFWKHLPVLVGHIFRIWWKLLPGQPLAGMGEN